MSVTTPSSNPNKMYKNSSLHCKNDSGELDVFEAARYFSGNGNDQNPAVNFSQTFLRDDHHRQHHQNPARMSLDMPTNRKPIILPAEYHHVIDQKQILKDQKKKLKQPSSPGGRLASFLNSLFNQTSLKKKKSKSVNNKDFDDESLGGRRKRRSSISHFRITNNNKSNNNAANDNTKSGFLTPPPYANTPTKSYKEFMSFPKNSTAINFKPTSLMNEINAEKTEENSRVPGNINFAKSEKINSRFSYRKSTTNCDDLMDFRKFSDPDDGADSDSSSDLFDLPNHELDFYSSSLPVYETTHMDRIKIAAPISRATTA